MVNKGKNTSTENEGIDDQIITQEKTRQHKTFIQFIKFGLVGVSNTVISYVTYAVLVFFGAPYLIANLIAFVVSVLNSFFWNNRYVFTLESGQTRSIWRSLAKTFASYSVTGLFLSSVLLWLWIDVFGISAYIAPIINLLVTVPLNFILNKFWAFKA